MSVILQHTFCLARRIQGEGHCNKSRLALYLPGLGKVKMLAQYPQMLGELFGGAAMTRRRRLRQYEQYENLEAHADGKDVSQE